jgi:hypothetical protein
MLTLIELTEVKKGTKTRRSFLGRYVNCIDSLVPSQPIAGFSSLTDEFEFFSNCHFPYYHGPYSVKETDYLSYTVLCQVVD